MSKASPKTEQWRDRKVETRRMRVGDVLPHPYNPKIHPESQLEPLRGLLREVGKVDDLKAYYSARAGGLTFFDGHARQSLDPDAEWDVDIYDLSDAEADLVVAAFDPLAALAQMDAPVLEKLLEQAQTDDAALREMLQSLATENGIELKPAKPVEDETVVAEIIDRAAELQEKWKVQAGDLYAIGSHRLLCGDSTKTEDVEKLMGARKARLFATDPPYGVDYVDKAQQMNALGYGHSRGTLASAIENDGMDEDELKAFLYSLFSLWWGDFCEQGACFYICIPGIRETAFLNAVSAYERVRQSIVWIKDNFVIGRQDYHWKHETILYGWLKGAAHHSVADRSQTTVWEIPRDSGDKIHPTMKPVELWKRMILNSTSEGDICAEPFIGSGGQFIAAEQTSRICYGMEIEPKYCAVTLERMTALGLEAKRLS